jgi:hypothetical protein
MKQTQILSWIIAVLIVLLVGISLYAYNKNTENISIWNHEMVMPTENDGDAAMREHCKGMPEMQGCEKYR